MRDEPHRGDERQKVYGRRKGHALRRHQAELVESLLPRLRLDLSRPAPPPDRGDFGLSQPEIINPINSNKSVRDALWPAPVREVWLEIGFGGGEHLAWQAGRNRDVGFIGCEPFVNGVAKLLAEVETHNLANIRIHDDDARDVLAWLPDGSIARCFILYPDPWPKARHNKRRIVSRETLAALARVMASGAELRIASDIPDYVDWILRRALANPAFAWQAGAARDWRERPDDWPQTRYESKALREGRTPAYLSFRRI